MKILVACEESQVVTIELRKLRHEAYSCDIEPCSGGHPEWHIQGDALKIINGNCKLKTMDNKVHAINQNWDLIIAHPPCTYLTTCCNRAYSLKHNTAEKVLERYKKEMKQLNFLWHLPMQTAKKLQLKTHKDILIRTTGNQIKQCTPIILQKTN